MNQPTDTQKLTQYSAAIIATLGGFIMGTALGWTSLANTKMENHQYGFTITPENISWIGSFMPLGAMLGCPITASLVDKLGRKNMMMIMALPTIVGWALMIWAASVEWLYVGRFFIGFASGSYTVIVPLYTAEIAEKEIRGTLGTYFQLQVAIGILYTYLTGTFFDVYGLSISCAIIPIVYGCLVIFIPESPNYYLLKGNVENARLSLKYFRGPYGTVDQELIAMQDSIAKAEREKVSIIKAFVTTPAKRGLFIGLGVMVFQQFTGCNAVIFYATFIFQQAGSAMDPNTSTIIVGIMSVLATYVSTFIVDRLGRRILLLYSVIIMGVCTLLIGAYFYMKNNNYDASSIGVIPLVSVCFFLILFSIGFGPIPWILIGEIFPAQIKGTACSIACMANWLFAFFVTKFFSSLVDAIKIYNTFWLFTLFSVLGTFFVLFIVPETKGKSMDEIQEMLGGVPSDHIPPIHQSLSNEENY